MSKFIHIFCDLDGTLFGKDLIVPARVVQRINSIYSKVGFSICTARGAKEAFPLLKKLKLSSPQIVENGAIVLNPNGKILRQKYIPENIIPNLIEFLSKYKIWKKIFRKGKIVEFLEIRKTDQITKIALQDLTETMFLEIEQEIRKYDNLISYSKSVAAHKPDFLTMDITNKEGTKQKAIEFVMKELNLNKREVIGIGDSYNDIILFAACGLKVAVKNAIPELIKIADYIAPSVDEGGVADVIDKFIVPDKKIPNPNIPPMA